MCLSEVNRPDCCVQLAGFNLTSKEPRSPMRRDPACRYFRSSIGVDSSGRAGAHGASWM
jgi:hypothetical protein